MTVMCKLAVIIVSKTHKGEPSLPLFVAVHLETTYYLTIQRQQWRGY